MRSSFSAYIHHTMKYCIRNSHFDLYDLHSSTTEQELLEHPKVGGFGDRHEEVIAWAEMLTPFDPENGKEEFRELQREQSIKRWFIPQNRRK